MSSRFLATALLVAILGASLVLPALAQSPPPPPVWNDPVLTWAGTTNYLDKGVFPTTAAPNTNFIFKIKYSHADGLPPAYVRLQLWGPEGGVFTGSPFTMSAESGSSYVTGVIYSVTVQLKKVGTYQYRFVTSDGGIVVQYPGANVSGPTVAVTAALTWAGIPQFLAKGVAPATAPSGKTFKYKVKYISSQAPASVSLQIWGPDANEIAGSPFAMTYDDPAPNWAAGVIFSANVPLTAVGTYQYKFTANTGTSFVYLPTGATRATGPVVTEAPSVSLAWTGLAGFVSDGVAPNAGAAGATYRFKVLCKDTNGAPDWVRLRLWGPDGYEVPGSPFDLTPESADWAAGVVCSTSLPLGAAGTYHYRFSAQHGTGTADLPSATTKMDAPVVSGSLFLSWTGLAGFVTDGLAPNTGVAGTVFRFKVKCTDGAGPPDWVRLRLWGPDGYEVEGSPFDLTFESATWATGVVCSTTRALSTPGTYQYRFEAQHGGATAALPGSTGAISGPVVTVP